MVPHSPLRGAARAALVLALVLFPALALAIGPVAPTSLPGGVSVSDNDSGSGEQWGRLGGRTITFNVNTPAAFSSLSWGAVSPPTAALDGVLNSPSETMNFSSAGSNLPSGIAQWSGFAPVFIVAPSSGTILVETRFTLRVTTPGGVPLPLAFTSGGPNPGIDVLASGPFRVNLLFEGRHSLVNIGNWTPLLQLYDTLETPVGNPPGTSGPALTGFNHGFYYETVSAPPPGGMTVDEHDDNVTPRLIGIRDDTAFLRIDTVNRLVDVQSGLDEVRTRVNLLPTEFPTFPDIPEIPSDIATSENVSSAKDDLSDILLILFGLMPCPAEAGPLCDSAIFVQDLATQASLDGVGEALALLQDSLDDVASQSSVDSISTRVTQLGTQLDTIEISLGGLAADPLSVEVIEVPDPPSPKHRRWIVKTTQGGALVDASLSRILSIRSKKLLPALAEDVTFRASAMAIGPGLLDVTLETGAGNGETVVYQIEVQHAGGEGTTEASALLATGAK